MKNLYKIKLNKQKNRFISTLIGTIIYFTGIISPLGIGQYSVYITSYFHFYNPKIQIQIGNLMMPILILFVSLSSPLGGILEHKIGMHLTLLINSILLEIFIFFFILQRNIYLTFLIIIFIGINIGTIIAIPMKNICFYYPNNKGIIMGLITSFNIIFGAIMNVLGEKIINPNKIIIKEGETYYPLEISKNYIKFYKLILIVIPACSIISLLLIKKYNPIFNDEQEQKLDKSINNLDKKDEYYSKNIKAAIFNSRIWKIASVSIFGQFVISFALNTFRVYGALISINGSVMQYSPLLFALSNIIFGPIWGYINDKLQSFRIAKFICLFSIIHSIIFCIFIKSNLMYIVCIFIGLIFNSGLQSIIQPHIMKIFGIKYSIEIGGVVSISVGIVNILKSSLSFFISLYYKTGKQLQNAYRFVYLIGVGINFLGFYYASKENEECFIYPYSPKNNSLENLEKTKNVNISQLPKNEIKIENNIK